MSQVASLEARDATRGVTAHAAPSVLGRLLLAACVTAAAAGVVVFTDRIGRTASTDFDQLWYGARFLLGGRSPYAEIGPGRTFPWPFPLVFPLPAVLIVSPLAGLPLGVARAVFASVGAGLFTFAVTRVSFAPALLCLSIPFLAAVRLGQWSTFISAAMFLSWATPLVAAKPNVGLATTLAAAKSTHAQLVAAGSAVALFGVSLVVLPTWPREWVAAVAASPHYPPYVFRAGGAVLLAVVLRWRRPEARVLLALACVPATPGPYDALILLAALFGTSPKEERKTILVFALLSDATLAVIAGKLQAINSFDDYLAALSTVNLLSIYFPALVLILRRPNVGEVPEWLDAFAERWRAAKRERTAGTVDKP